MFKKVLAFMLCLALVFSLAGCSLFNKDYVASDTEYIDITSTVSSKPVEEKYVINPLTGVKDLPKEKANTRPVAVMINNISVAQRVQTGLNAADIIYETEVEGGITRLMAVYKDLSSVGQIGSIRSARYPYVDLALGHNAIYLHCGQDNRYCRPHLRDIDDMSVDTGTKGAKRIRNGLAVEHTLFIFGNEIWNTIASKFKTEATTPVWQNFATDGSPVTPTGGGADEVQIPFPVLKTVFKYDSTTGLYNRYSRGNLMKDDVTKENVAVKNVFILMTSITNYPDGKHRKVALNGGSGYYITNGTYTPISWQKNGEKAPVKMTTVAGGDLNVNPGRSWVCLPNSATCKPIITSKKPAESTTSSTQSK